MKKSRVDCPHSEHGVIIIGAGFSGIYALYHLRSPGFSVKLMEAASGPGGTNYAISVGQFRARRWHGELSIFER